MELPWVRESKVIEGYFVQFEVYKVPQRWKFVLKERESRYSAKTLSIWPTNGLYVGEMTEEVIEKIDEWLNEQGHPELFDSLIGMIKKVNSWILI